MIYRQDNFKTIIMPINHSATNCLAFIRFCEQKTCSVCKEFYGSKFQVHIERQNYFEQNN